MLARPTSIFFELVMPDMLTDCVYGPLPLQVVDRVAVVSVARGAFPGTAAMAESICAPVYALVYDPPFSAIQASISTLNSSCVKLAHLAQKKILPSLPTKLADPAGLNHAPSFHAPSELCAHRLMR